MEPVPRALNEIAEALNRKFDWIRAGQGLIAGREEQIEVRSISLDRFEHGFMSRAKAQALLAMESENARAVFRDFIERP